MKINKKAKLADLLKKNPDMTLEDLLESTASGKKKRSKKDDGIKNDKLKELQEEAFNKELEGKTGVIGRLKGGVKGAQKSFELQQEFKTAKTGVKSRYGNIAKAFGADPKSAAMIDRIFGKKVDDKELTKLREKFNLDEKAKPKKEKKEAEKKETVQKDLTDNISKIFDIVKEIRSVVEGIANKLRASPSKEVPTTKKAMRKLEKDSGLKYSKETGRYHDIKTKKMVGAETARQKMNLSPSALKVAGIGNSGAALAGAAAGGTASKVMEGKAETVKGPNPATEEEVSKVGEGVDKVGENVKKVSDFVEEILDMFSLKKFYGLIGGAIGAAFPLLIKAGELIYKFFSAELDLYKKIGSAIWDFLKDMLLKVDFTLPLPKAFGGPIHFAPFSFLKGSDAAAPVPPKEGAAPPKEPAAAPEAAPPKEPAAAPEAAPPKEPAAAAPEAEPAAAPPAPAAAAPAAAAPTPTATPQGSNMAGGSPPSGSSDKKAANDSITVSGGKAPDLSKVVTLQNSGVDIKGLDDGFEDRVAKMAAAFKDATGKTLMITSGVRSDAKQLELWNKKYAEIKKQHPDWDDAKLKAATRKWVALPQALGGKGSAHNSGLAVDINSKGAAGIDAIDGSVVNGQKMTTDSFLALFGLIRPLNNEAWHVQASGTPPTPDNPTPGSKPIVADANGKDVDLSTGQSVQVPDVPDAVAQAGPAPIAGNGGDSSPAAAAISAPSAPTASPPTASPVPPTPSTDPTASPVETPPTYAQAVAENTTEVTAAKEQMVASNVSPAPRISVPARPQASPKPPNPDHSVKASARLVEDTFTRALAKDFSHPSAFTTVSMV